VKHLLLVDLSCCTDYEAGAASSLAGVQVQLVDHGPLEVVDRQDIREMPRELGDIPVQSVFCSLAGLPDESERFVLNEADLVELRKLCYDQIIKV